MKKFIYVISLYLCIYSASAAVSKTITITQAGTLNGLLTSNDKATVTNLSIIGYIDARDVKCIRDEMKVLTMLDITDVFILSYTGTLGTIPSDIEYPADEMPSGSFSSLYCSSPTIKSIIFPTSLITIGVSAFYNCNTLTGNLTIPNSVIAIREDAFHNCVYLSGNLILSNSLISIGNGAFAYCGLSGTLTIPNSVTSIGEFAFSGCNRFSGNLILSNSLVSIGSSAFSFCAALSGILTIPNSLNSIGDDAFARCTNLTNFIVESSNKRYSSSNGVVYSILKDTLIVCPPGKTGNMVIPNTVKCINKNAFNQCKGLTGELTLPNSVTVIGDGSFYGCYGLTGSITIPGTLTSLGDQAFIDCTNLTNFIVEPSNKRYSSTNGVIYNFLKDTLIVCPTGKTGNMVIPNTVKCIYDYAFYDCKSLTTLLLSNILSSIGTLAFYKCYSFTGTLTIPNSVKSIGALAFYDCKGFTGALVLPNSLITIKNSVFSGCSSFTSIYANSNTPNFLMASVFNGVDKIVCILYVPFGCISLYQNADQWKDFKNIVEMPSTGINNPLLEKVNIFTSVSSIIIDGISHGEIISIYRLNGVQVYSIKSNGDRLIIPIQHSGIYIVKTKNKTVKIVL